MDSFEFTLVTPEAAYFSGPARMVEAPGTLGDFGVLPGHMNFISTLRPGVIAVHAADEAVMRLFVAGGIAEVNNVSCTILAEQVTDLNQVTRAEAEARLAAARAALDQAFDEPAQRAAQRDLDINEALLLAYA